MDVRAEVTLAGPLFDGRAEQALDDYLARSVEVVSDRGAVAVREELDLVLQNPTGFYGSQVVADRESSDRGVVHDSGVVYGPWLAGQGSRNATSDFDGYDHWRLATERLDQQAAELAQREIGPYLDRMNG